MTLGKIVQSHEFERKPMLEPFTCVNDPRSLWLYVFLKYFLNWLNSTEQCQGSFTKYMFQKMFILWHMYEGLKTTVNPTIEATQFILQHQAAYVLTERFFQFSLENYFCRQRSIGLRKNNPSMADFGYNNNAIRNQNIFKTIVHISVADTGMVALTDGSLSYQKKSRKE